MLTDITLGQYFPGTSFLHKLDPRIKIVATMIFIVAIFFAHSLASYAIVTAFVALNFAISRLPAKFIVKALKPCGSSSFSPWASISSRRQAMSSGSTAFSTSPKKACIKGPS